MSSVRPSVTLVDQDGLWAWKSGDFGLIVRAISFQDFQLIAQTISLKGNYHEKL